MPLPHRARGRRWLMRPVHALASCASVHQRQNIRSDRKPVVAVACLCSASSRSRISTCSRLTSMTDCGRPRSRRKSAEPSQPVEVTRDRVWRLARGSQGTGPRQVEGRDSRREELSAVESRCARHARPPFLPSGLSTEEALCLTWKVPFGFKATQLFSNSRLVARRGQTRGSDNTSSPSGRARMASVGVLSERRPI